MFNGFFFDEDRDMLVLRVILPDPNVLLGLLIGNLGRLRITCRLPW